MTWLDKFFGNATSIQGRPISEAAPAAGQVLAFNGTQWLPSFVTGTLATIATASALLPPITGSGLKVPFDTNAGPMTLTISATTADGQDLAFLDAGRVTDAAHALTIQDANGYLIQDPDTMGLAPTYVLTQVRNLTLTRITCPRTATTFWAAGT